MKNSLVLIIVFLLGMLPSHGQEKQAGIILTFNVKEKPSHGLDLVYYWYIPEKSIDVVKNEFEIYPFYINTFSKDNLDDCINKKSIDLFTHTVKTNYDFNINFEEFLKSLIVKLEKRSKKVENIVIEKGFFRKNKKEINISIAYVRGSIIYCNIKDKMSKVINRKTKVVFPISNILFDNNELKSDKLMEFIFQTDFSQFKYENNQSSLVN